MRKFTPYSVDGIKEYIEKNLKRQIKEIHIHHTWKPEHKNYAGERTIFGMWEYHTKTNGWSDIGQHFSVAPDGTIWDGRDLSRDPASISGRNQGALSIEMIGNFDIGHDELKGKQREAVIQLVLALLSKTGLTTKAVKFHREYSPKSCPGTSIDKTEFISWIEGWQKLESNKFTVIVYDWDGLTVKLPDDAVRLENGETWVKAKVITQIAGGKVGYDAKTNTATFNFTKYTGRH